MRRTKTNKTQLNNFGVPEISYRTLNNLQSTRPFFWRDVECLSEFANGATLELIAKQRALSASRVRVIVRQTAQSLGLISPMAAALKLYHVAGLRSPEKLQEVNKICALVFDYLVSPRFAMREVRGEPSSHSKSQILIAELRAEIENLKTRETQSVVPPADRDSNSNSTTNTQP
jgi:hypothetical protein